VTFVERDRRATALIAENLATCGVEEGDYTIRGGDMVAALEALEAGSCGLIVLDPPYDSPIRGVLDAAARVIAPGGLIVLERATRREPDTPAVLARVRDVTSGDSTLTFFELARPA
jgi:16S rRNA (guanine966-N2)-methyltransferase